MGAQASIESAVNEAGKLTAKHPIAIGAGFLFVVILFAFGNRKSAGSRPGQMSDELKGQLIQADVMEHSIDAQESVANMQSRTALQAVRSQSNAMIRAAGIDSKTQLGLGRMQTNLERYITGKTLDFNKWSQKSEQQYLTRENASDRSFQEKLMSMLYDYQKSADYWIAYNERKLVPLQLQNSAYIARQQREAMVAPYTSATGVLGGVGGVIGNLARLVGSFYGGEMFSSMGSSGGAIGGMTNQQAGQWIPGGFPKFG